MEFRDLKTQYSRNKEQIDGAIQRVLQNTDFILGREVLELEEKLSEYVGEKYCITCGNGTDALQLALMTWEIGKGDAVFVPDFTFFSTGEVVAAVGATPIFVDVEWETCNISTEDLERKIAKVNCEKQLRPKAVICVDLFGLPARFRELRKIVKKYGLYLLEDGAQGFGGKIGEKRACSFGDISTTSFFPAKPLGCYGDGGAVFTGNAQWADKLRSYRVHGKGIDKYDNIRIGMNSRLDTLQASVLIEKLKIFREYELDRVNEIAGWYNDCLKSAVEVPVIESGYYSSWAQYTIKLRNSNERQAIIDELKKENIPSAIYYKKPLRKQKAFTGNGEYEEESTVTDKLCDKVLSLPMHPYLQREEVVFISDVVRSVSSKF